ncbi:MAG: response regulator transcription factor [Odoribacter sp.]
MKILIIEDEKELSLGIVAYLSAEDYRCEVAYSFEEAMDKVVLYDYDCVLLDLMLPGGDGLEVLETLKRAHKSCGVIIISAKDALEDKLRGLKIGADDYLPKPFFLSELSMRIYALIRRQQFLNQNELISGKLRIDLLAKEVFIEKRTVVLTKKEYDLLLFLIGNKNKVISKSAIAEHLSGDMADMLDSYDFVYAHIKNLKNKLSEASCPDYLKNVYGTGYKWVE